MNDTENYYPKTIEKRVSFVDSEDNNRTLSNNFSEPGCNMPDQNFDHDSNYSSEGRYSLQHTSRKTSALTKNEAKNLKRNHSSLGPQHSISNQQTPQPVERNAMIRQNAVNEENEATNNRAMSNVSDGNVAGDGNLADDEAVEINQPNVNVANSIETGHAAIQNTRANYDFSLTTNHPHLPSSVISENSRLVNCFNLRILISLLVILLLGVIGIISVIILVTSAASQEEMKFDDFVNQSAMSNATIVNYVYINGTLIDAFNQKQNLTTGLSSVVYESTIPSPTTVAPTTIPQMTNKATIARVEDPATTLAPTTTLIKSSSTLIGIRLKEIILRYRRYISVPKCDLPTGFFFSL